LVPPGPRISDRRTTFPRASIDDEVSVPLSHAYGPTSAGDPGLGSDDDGAGAGEPVTAGHVVDSNEEDVRVGRGTTTDGVELEDENGVVVNVVIVVVVVVVDDVVELEVDVGVAVEVGVTDTVTTVTGTGSTGTTVCVACIVCVTTISVVTETVVIEPPPFTGTTE
jgi:hypothetical protein